MKRTTIRWCASLATALWLSGAHGCADESDDGEDMNATAGAPTSASGGADGSGGSSGDDGEGSGDVDNVAACNDLVDSLECGGTDLGQYVPCDSYAQTTCDFGDYFQCLEDEFTCTDGAFDPTAWMGCASLASCD